MYTAAGRCIINSARGAGRDLIHGSGTCPTRPTIVTRSVQGGLRGPQPRHRLLQRPPPHRKLSAQARACAHDGATPSTGVKGALSSSLATDWRCPRPCSKKAATATAAAHAAAEPEDPMGGLVAPPPPAPRAKEPAAPPPEPDDLFGSLAGAGPDPLGTDPLGGSDLLWAVPHRRPTALPPIRTQSRPIRSSPPNLYPIR